MKFPISKSEQEIVDRIVEIANRKEVKLECEPNIIEPATIHSYAVIRIMRAQEIYLQEEGIEDE